MDKSSVCLNSKNRKYLLIKMKTPTDMYMIVRTQSRWELDMCYYTGTNWSDDITDGATYSLDDAKNVFNNLKMIRQNKCKSRIPEIIIDQFEDCYMSSKLEEGDF